MGESVVPATGLGQGARGRLCDFDIVQAVERHDGRRGAERVGAGWLSKPCVFRAENQLSFWSLLGAGDGESRYPGGPSGTGVASGRPGVRSTRAEGAADGQRLGRARRGPCRGRWALGGRVAGGRRCTACTTRVKGCRAVEGPKAWRRRVSGTWRLPRGLCRRAGQSSAGPVFSPAAPRWTVCSTVHRQVQ